MIQSKCQCGNQGSRCWEMGGCVSDHPEARESPGSVLHPPESSVPAPVSRRNLTDSDRRAGVIGEVREPPNTSAICVMVSDCFKLQGPNVWKKSKVSKSTLSDDERKLFYRRTLSISPPCRSLCCVFIILGLPKLHLKPVVKVTSPLHFPLLWSGDVTASSPLNREETPFITGSTQEALTRSEKRGSQCPVALFFGSCF